MSEISRVLKNDGWFIGSFPSREHSLFRDIDHHKDRQFVILDPARKEQQDARIMCPLNRNGVFDLLSNYFSKIEIGKQSDEYMNFNRNFYYFVCFKAKT